MTKNTLYQYALKRVRVVDGDTLEGDIDLGFGVMLSATKVRLSGINCPEKDTELGKAAKVFTQQWISKVLDSKVDVIVLVKKHKKDKYGRVLGIVSSNGEDLAQQLEMNGHAKPYDGTGVKPT
jgi:endonuclease YncB( thermonuclease family)